MSAVAAFEAPFETKPPGMEHLEDGTSDLKDDRPLEETYIPDTEAEKKLVRKIDLRLLPVLWVMYIFNYIDRANIGNAKTGGMQADLHLTSSDYSLILSIFFVAYLLCEVPSNMILARTKPSLYLPSIMVIWGAVSIGVKGVNSLAGMVVFRVALGLIESGFFPGTMLIMSCWYKPSEMSKRLFFFYTASLMGGAFGGLLAGGIISGMEGKAGVRGWKWLFIIEGCATVVAACCAYFILPDYPMTTKWLSDDEKRLATQRLLSRNDIDDSEVGMSHRTAFIAAVKDPKTWLFMFTYNLLNCVNTISYFFPTLMNSLGYTGHMAQYMTVPIYTVALVVGVAMGINADRTGQKAWHVLAAAIWGSLSFIVCVTVKNHSAVRYAFICFAGAGIWSAIPIFLSWTVTMFEGRERRAISIAIVNGLGATSSTYGSFFWPSNTAPQYVMGFSITTSLFALAGAIVVCLKWKYDDKGYIGGRHGA